MADEQAHDPNVDEAIAPLVEYFGEDMEEPLRKFAVKLLGHADERDATAAAEPPDESKPVSERFVEDVAKEGDIRIGVKEQPTVTDDDRAQRTHEDDILNAIQDGDRARVEQLSGKRYRGNRQ